MSVELKVPAVGESITEVQIGQWLKGEGEHAEQDENLVEIETDKATVEIAAPVSGTITKVLKQTGETATVGEVIGYIEATPARRGNEQAESDPAAAAKAQAARTIQTPRPKAEQAPRAAEPRRSPEPAPQPAAAATTEAKEPQRAKPASPAPSPPARQREPAKLQPRNAVAVASPAAAPIARGDREEEAVPMSPIRRRIAERLVEAQHQAALLTTFNEIDMSSVSELRNEHKQVFLDRYGIKLGFMSFFVKAAIDALKLVPQVNAEI
ncbi:MAG TPA: biotin/lipoyl-containing protein, partial [Pirellulales bacterium]